jgi:CheY-like chemotaxis protein
VSHAPRILIVDDDAFIRRPLELILRAEGFEPHTAVDGDDCLRRLETLRPDLIILDIMMPGRDGFEVCRRVKEDPRLREIPVVLLSARGRPVDLDKGIALGAAGYVTKPYSPTDLLRKVRGLLESGNACAEGGKGECQA